MSVALRQDIRTVQALRALACALVVTYHAAGTWQPARDADAIWPNGAAGVDVFFVISGLVMAQAGAGLSGPGDAWRFALRRCRRLVPLYWLMTGAKLMLVALSGTAAFGAWHVAASLLFIPARDAHGAVRPLLGVGWTLQFECLFYIVFALAVALRLSAWRLLPLLAPLAVAGFFRRADWPAPCVLANGLVLEFCLGLAVGRVCTVWRLSPALSASLFAFGLLLILSVPPPGPWRFLAWGVPAAMVLAGAVWLEPACGACLPRWLLAAGDASYAVYLLHPFVVPLVARLMPAQTGLWPLALAALGASGLGGAALHRWVDRPCQRWLASGGRPARGFLPEPMAQLIQP